MPTKISQLVLADDVAQNDLIQIVDVSDTATMGVLSGTNKKVTVAALAAKMGAQVTVSDSAPLSPAAGAIWFNSLSGITSIYYDSAWVDIGGGDSIPSVTSTLGSSSITNDKLAFDGGSLGFRNKIINGAMRVDQRNAGAAVVWNTASAGNSNSHPVDRFRASVPTNGLWGSAVISAQQSTDCPDEFDTSLKLTSTTADVSLAPAEAYGFVHVIEGNNMSDLAFGTSSAKPIAISFWVKSSLVGKYCVSFCNNGDARCMLSPYVINAANTWEYKTITVSGDTIGPWITNEEGGMRIRWNLAAGANFTISTAGAWQTGLYLRTTDSVNWIATVGATFSITGVQLEKGTVATPFEHRPIGTELALCQRYYCKSYPLNIAAGTAYIDGGNPNVISASQSPSLFPCNINFPVSMRAMPTATIYKPSVANSNGKIEGVNQAGELIITSVERDQGGIGLISTSTAGTGGAIYQFQYTADAEL